MLPASCLVRAARAILRPVLIGRNKRPTSVFAFCLESRHLVRMRASRPHLAALIDAIAAPLAASSFLVAVAGLYPIRRAFEIDPDEGINAALAFLIARGHRLYYEAWTDHAPPPDLALPARPA